MKHFQKVYDKVCYRDFFFFINYANLATYIPRVLLTQFKANNFHRTACLQRAENDISVQKRKNPRKRNTLKYAKYFQMSFNFFLTRIQLNTLGMPV